MVRYEGKILGESFNITDHKIVHDNVPVIAYIKRDTMEHWLIGTFERSTLFSFRGNKVETSTLYNQYQMLCKVLSDNQTGNVLKSEIISFETFESLFKDFQSKHLHFEWVSLETITQLEVTSPLIVVINNINKELK